MKQFVSAFTFLLATGLAAQTPIVTLRDAGDNVVNGTTLIVYGNPTSVELEQDVTAELNASSARNINVRRHELNVVPGSKNYFCWGVCYIPRLSGQTPTWVSLDPISMVPQDTISNFHAYYRPSGTSAYCCFQYVWYDVSNPDDSTWVNICFDTQTFTGMQDLAVSGPSLNAYPNPVAGGADVALEYQLADAGSAQVVVYNTLGTRAFVRSLTGNAGRALLPTTTLAPGVWFAALEQNGRMVATRRFVVTR